MQKIITIHPSNFPCLQNIGVAKVNLWLETANHGTSCTVSQFRALTGFSLVNNDLPFPEYYFVRQFLSLQAHIHCESMWFNLYVNPVL
jgi:hypothetical protein